MEIKDLRQRENDCDLPTHVWWEVPPFIKIPLHPFCKVSIASHGIIDSNMNWQKMIVYIYWNKFYVSHGRQAKIQIRNNMVHFSDMSFPSDTWTRPKTDHMSSLHFIKIEKLKISSNNVTLWPIDMWNYTDCMYIATTSKKYLINYFVSYDCTVQYAWKFGWVPVWLTSVHIKLIFWCFASFFRCSCLDLLKNYATM